VLTAWRAELRNTAQTKYEQCMEVPPLANRQPTAEQAALVARLRGEIEEAHKVRRACQRLACRALAEGFSRRRS
jgi:hypothetical protein